MKTVLYVICGFDVSTNGGVMNRCLSFVRCFSSHGYRVIVVALPIAKEYFRSLSAKKSLPGIADWVVFPHYYSWKPTILNLFSFVDKAFLYLLSLIKKPAYILADGGTSCFLCSWASSRTPLIANFRADQSDEFLFQYGYQQETVESKKIKDLDRYAAEISSYSICVSTKLRDYLISLGAPLKNNFIFPCCADIDRFKNVQSIDTKDIVIGYFGGTAPWQCIQEVINLVISLRELSADYKLLLLCSGNLSAYNEELSLLGEDNYSVFSLSNAEMPQYIARMDLSVALRDNRNLNIVSSPTKLSESLAAGVPLLVTRSCGDYADFLEPGTNGIIIDGIKPTTEDIKAIDSFCRKVKSDRRHYFNICRDSVKNRTQAHYSDSFIEMIESK